MRSWKNLFILLVCAILEITHAQITVLNQDILESALQEAKEWHESLLQDAMSMGAQTLRPKRFIKKYTKETVRMGEIYNLYKKAEKILISKYMIDPEVARDATEHARQAECPMPTEPCDTDSKYRTITGQCNNLRFPLYGSTYQPLVRAIDPEYLYGDHPRGGYATSLPSPRLISNIVHSNNQSDGGGNKAVTHMVAQFGQFLDHDITATPEGGKPCCLPEYSEDPDCFPIDVELGDPHYCPNVTFPCFVDCLEFTRSTPHCQAPGRQQMNIITAFVDASNIYGSDDRLTKMLRTFTDGKLEENSRIRGFLPWRSDVDPSSNADQILAGDFRANEMPGLTTMHTLFLKEHNRVATLLSENTFWDDEKIFQEARRIVIAEMQQITYEEYLPATLGTEAMETYQLSLTDNPTIYNDNTNPTITNNFATAAYRFGHTLVNGLIDKFRVGASVPYTSYLIADNYFVPNEVVEETTGTMTGYSEILNGLIRQEAQPSDVVLVDGLRNSLFKQHENMGTDLVARNIQRGRDHGLPGYNAFRALCGLEPLTQLDSLSRPSEIPQGTWDNILQVYGGIDATVDDIDLYTGGLAETPVLGGQAGPTFVCLMALQFNKLKYGDRFFFTHANQTGSFTNEQRLLLRKRRLGDIICENSELEETPLNVFRPVVTSTNPMLSCQDERRQPLDIELFINSLSFSSRTIIVPIETTALLLLSSYILTLL